MSGYAMGVILVNVLGCKCRKQNGKQKDDTGPNGLYVPGYGKCREGGTKGTKFF